MHLQHQLLECTLYVHDCDAFLHAISSHVASDQEIFIAYSYRCDSSIASHPSHVWPGHETSLLPPLRTRLLPALAIAQQSDWL